MDTIINLMLFFVTLMFVILVSMFTDKLKEKLVFNRLNKKQFIKTMAFRGALVSQKELEKLEMESIEDYSVFAPLCSGLRCGDYSIDTSVKQKVLAIEYHENY